MELSGDQTCLQASGIVYQLVADAMSDPGTTQVGIDRGYAGLLDFYIAGRCGVLGDVDADVVVASFEFFQPERLRAVWERVLQIAPAREASSLYGPTIARQGAAAMTGFADGLRLAELLERVVDEAHAAGLPLFAGWRAEPRPAQPLERACHAMHLLREWRGGAHLAAVTALGISPFDAVVINGGTMYTEFYEWPPSPCTEQDRHRANLRRAEELTDGQCAPVFERALTGTERSELVELLVQAADCAARVRAARPQG